MKLSDQNLVEEELNLVKWRQVDEQGHETKSSLFILYPEHTSNEEQRNYILHQHQCEIQDTDSLGWSRMVGRFTHMRCWGTTREGVVVVRTSRWRTLRSSYDHDPQHESMIKMVTVGGG